MRVRLGLLLLFATALLSAHAAEPICLGEIPFEFRDGLIEIKVHATNSARPLTFLLDSGAGVSVLNLHTAERLGLKPAARVTVQGVGANTIGYWPQHLTATAAHVTLPSEYLAVDLSALSDACTCPIDGLIGADFFCDRIVRIDFTNRIIRLLTAAPASKGQELLTLKQRHRALLIQLRVNNSAPAWVRLDTGCASSLQWAKASILRSSNAPRLAVALSQITLQQTQTSVQIGQTVFQDVPTGLHRKPIFAGEAGLLGNGLLSRFAAITVDSKSDRLLLEPSHSSQP
jgi:hypothetical protein